mmetsp:Transcript_13850/g.28951  ORF Transcript_13850/g.28951 Transcript_13850/m.28951 type:complete len:204 (-) Transcript_13850:140-751(-)
MKIIIFILAKIQNWGDGAASRKIPRKILLSALLRRRLCRLRERLCFSIGFTTIEILLPFRDCHYLILGTSFLRVKLSCGAILILAAMKESSIWIWGDGQPIMTNKNKPHLNRPSGQQEVRKNLQKGGRVRRRIGTNEALAIITLSGTLSSFLFQKLSSSSDKWNNLKNLSSKQTIHLPTIPLPWHLDDLPLPVNNRPDGDGGT